MGIGERIKKRRLELGLTVDQLADMLGKNRATVYRYESNEIENFPTTIIEPLATALRTTPSALMGWEDSSPHISTYSNIHPIGTKRFPVLSSVACGEPILMQDEKELYIDASEEIKADYVLIAKGDSMTGARIHDGDVVFIREQPTVENGEIAVVAIDDEATLKRVFWYASKSVLVLRAENPDYADMEFSGDTLGDVRILGKAVAFQSEVK